jgi:hypothetical protein
MRGFSVKDIFPLNGPGIKTERDSITIHFEKQSLKDVIYRDPLKGELPQRGKFGISLYTVKIYFEKIRFLNERGNAKKDEKSLKTARKQRIRRLRFKSL